MSGHMRFQRQILLLGHSGQEALISSKVLIIGAGGLGHPAIQYLAAMGVGSLGIVDGDTVSESNLHRQIIFDINDIGKNKAQVIEEKIKFRKEPIKVTAYPQFLDKKLALEVFPHYDLVLDGTDNFESKFLINDLCCFLNKPMVYGSVSQFEGHVSVFWKDNGPCYRCLVPQKPSTQIQSCADAGVIGVLPGIIGSMQALEAMKILLYLKGQRKFETLLGFLKIFNFEDNSVFHLKLLKRSNCFCSQKQIRLQDIKEISDVFCSTPLKAELIDVRELNEYKEFNIEGALHWPLSKLLQGELPQLSSEKEWITICKSGTRAEKASAIFRANGYSKVSFTKESIYGYQNRQSK